MSKPQAEAAQKEKDAPQKKKEDKEYKTKASFREPAKNMICSFSGLLQALDGVMAQEGRLVSAATPPVAPASAPAAAPAC